MEHQQSQPEKKPDDKIIELAAYLKEKIQQRFEDLKKEKKDEDKKEKEDEDKGGKSESAGATLSGDPKADELIFES